MLFGAPKKMAHNSLNGRIEAHNNAEERVMRA